MIVELFLIVIALTIYYTFSKYKSENQLPPGPWGFPLLGHLPLLGLSPYSKLMEWKRIYGKIFFIRFGSFPTVVLHDAELIREAFNLPAFSGRAQLALLVEGSEGGKGLGPCEGTASTEQRQFYMKTMRNLGREMEITIQQNVSELINNIKEQSGRGESTLVTKLFTTFILNSLWNVIMGQKFQRDDPEVQKIIFMMNQIGEIDSAVEQMGLFMPWFANLLGRFSGHEARVGKMKNSHKYFEEKIAERRLTWIKGQPRDFTDAYFDKAAETVNKSSSFHEQNRFQAHTAMSVFGAAVTTTAHTLEWLLYYLAGNKEIQKKIQNEIDHVMGSSRVPCLSDRSQMPYAEAVTMEILRISSVLPFGVFHRTLSNIEFGGYKIPRDTMVFAHIHGIHHDKEIWGDPEKFRPERFLTEDGKNVQKSKNLVSFSFGRRACVGETNARDNLFLYLTSLCQIFDITFPAQVPHVKVILGLTAAPSVFHVHFRERTRF